MRPQPMENNVSDEMLIAELASGRQDAIGALYCRYAPAVLGMAAQALDRPAAEEIVQEVFLAVWKGSPSFDPKRGAVRPWLFQIAHNRIANELRRRRRRPRTETASETDPLASVPDPAPGPPEEIWNQYRHAALRRALQQLPPPQRQALGLAFFDELSHDEIARTLSLPLGTAKSRIRAGLHALRAHLAPIIAILAGVAILGGLALRLRAGRAELARDERALTMLTSSAGRTLRMTVPGAPQSPSHGVYRYVPGSPVAVFTISEMPPPPSGRVYRLWMLHGGTWTALGGVRPDTSGHARHIAEDPALASPPDRLEVTLEPQAAGAAPAGPVIIAWP